MENRQLYHHGIKGMRWGIRRYQNADGSLTPAGKKHYRLGKDGQLIKKKRVSRKVQKQRKANLEKARQARTEKKQHEADKERVVKSGSAKELLKYKGELTKQEMDAAWARIQWEQNVAGVAAKEVSAGKSRVDRLFKNMDDVTGKVNTALKAYNTVANIYNALNPKGMLPKIDTNITGGNRDQYKAHKKEQKKAEDAKKKRAEQEAQKESKRAERAKKRESQTTERYEPGPDDIFGPNTSSKNKSSTERGRTIINDKWNADKEWTSVEVSGVPATVASRGRSSASSAIKAIGQTPISGLLEDHSR